MKGQYKISIIIPAYNEEKNVKPLFSEIKNIMSKVKKPYEVIFIDDGSTDDTYKQLLELKKFHKNINIKVVGLRGNWGKSIALQTGFELAKGEIVFTMDADLQDDPKEIPNFIKKIDEGYDLVSGWKKERFDPASKVIPSRILNFIIRKSTGLKIHDTNCGYKAYRKEVVNGLNLYGELYRYIPIIAAKENYRIGEIVVNHRRRKHGKSKYGIGRNIKGLLDLLTILFLTDFLRRPAHFFGSLGLTSFGAGFLIGLYISFLRITTGSIQNRHPLLFLGMLLMIIGIQMITTGLIAELIVKFNNKLDVERITRDN